MNNNNSLALDVLLHTHRLQKYVAGDLHITQEGVYVVTPVYKKRFIGGAQKIIGSQKYAYNDETITLVEQTSSLDLEEVIANLDKISFPFDQLWIEGPGDAKGKSVGYVIETNSANNSFSFQRFARVSGRTQIGSSVEESQTIFCNRVPVTVDKNGVHFDEDFLLADLEDTYRQIIQSPLTAGLDHESHAAIHQFLVNEIDALNQSADFLARLFAAMGADRARKPLPAATAADLKQEIELNRRRARMNGKPKLLSEPRPLDLSRDLFRTRSPQAKHVRALLGWTIVRRSKQIISKSGIVFTRKPHDRRIPSAVDRREQTRAITASDTDLTLSFGPHRPLLEKGKRPPEPHSHS